MGDVRALRTPVNENLVGALREWLAMAERGEITGAVLLGNAPSSAFASRWSGEMPFSVALLAFESLKLRVLRDHVNLDDLDKP